MTSVAAMIPVLLGSKRVPDKNIIIVDGKVLCEYTIDACLDADCFDSVSLYSEDDIFKSIAERKQIDFRFRPAEWGGRECQQKTRSRNCAGARCVINEHYLYHFMKNFPEVDYICQVNSTSPLLEGRTIRAFVDELRKGNYDCLFATTELGAESFYQDKPVNFTRQLKQPSNELDPIQSICWAIAGWRRQTFIDAYERDAPNEEAPVFSGNLGLYPIDEREALDIDHWSTLDVVDQFLKARRSTASRTWHYLDGRTVTRN